MVIMNFRQKRTIVNKAKIQYPTYILTNGPYQLQLQMSSMKKVFGTWPNNSIIEARSNKYLSGDFLNNGNTSRDHRAKKQHKNGNDIERDE